MVGQIVKQLGRAADVRVRVAGNFVHGLSSAGFGCEMQHALDIDIYEHLFPISRPADVAAEDLDTGAPEQRPPGKIGNSAVNLGT